MPEAVTWDADHPQTNKRQADRRDSFLKPLFRVGRSVLP